MPYLSESQRRWAHTSTGKKALGGASKVAEWDASSKGKKLPGKKGSRTHGIQRGRGARIGSGESKKRYLLKN